MGIPYIDNYATRVGRHCDSAKASTFMCETASAKGNFETAKSSVKDAIAELQAAITELQDILPEENPE